MGIENDDAPDIVPARPVGNDTVPEAEPVYAGKIVKQRQQAQMDEAAGRFDGQFPSNVPPRGRE